MNVSAERQAQVVEKLQDELRKAGELYQYTLTEDTVLRAEFAAAGAHAYERLKAQESRIAHLEYELARSATGHVPALVAEYAEWEELIETHQAKCDAYDESQAQLELSRDHVGMLQAEVATNEATITRLQAELKDTREVFTAELITQKRRAGEDMAMATEAAHQDLDELRAVVAARGEELMARIAKLESDLAEAALRESDFRKSLRDTQTKLADAEVTAMQEAIRIARDARASEAMLLKVLTAEYPAMEEALHELATTSAARLAELEKEVARLTEELALATRAASASSGEMQQELTAERERREVMRDEYESLLRVWPPSMREAEAQVHAVGTRGAWLVRHAWRGALLRSLTLVCGLTIAMLSL